MRALENLKPEKVFYYFEDICRIPHGSGNLDKISGFLERFAQDRGLYHIRDKANNVIIVKEATDGYEEAEPIILQGHIDMVAVKKKDCDIDLEKDALRLKTEGDYVYAEGTSLGGDDGIAVAYILALLDSDDIPHPRIEAVLTADEEVGMDGASAIDLSGLKARRMLNIDSEEEGILLTSCAGGVRVDCKIPIKRVSRSADMQCLELKVGGLQGGHSGTEIDKERGNAIQLLGTALCQLMQHDDFAFKLADIRGGDKDNAIPIEASAVLCVNKDKVSELMAETEKIAKEMKNEYRSKEKKLFVEACLCEGNADIKNTFDRESTQRAVAFLTAMPNGVQAMSADIEGLVETSLNAGILTCNENGMVVSFALRSAIETAKKKLKLKLDTLAGLVGGRTQEHGDYPGWQFNPDSKLRADMVRIYQEMFGTPPKVEELHAGLECGIMISKLPGLDCVSFGPDILDIHTTEERLSISSTKRMWDYLLEILKQK
ncbi:MAG: aminoacyl-histidine dipeptidase [Lachnospiraceae bacterium]|nr:aminoacyl-histidine dipeptidase [Lachnospiraceae bacterium]